MSAARINDGGSAFPMPGANYTEDCGDFQREQSHGPQAGMTLRDYFIAHAPAEPPQWFQAVMPTPCPDLPTFPKAPTAEKAELEYVREFHDVIDPKQIRSPELRLYVQEKREIRLARSQWYDEAAKQRCLQWPAAWADAMLKARQS